jgi:anti-sigma factor (TIGR02949 family)
MNVPLPDQPERADCATFLASLDAVASGEADAVTAMRAGSHAASCGTCRAALGAARGYRRVLRQVGESVQAPAALRDRVLGLLRGVRGSSRTP